MKKFLMFLGAVTLVFGVMGSANASLMISGKIWEGITDANGVVTTAPAGPATSTFTIAGEFNFNSNITGANLGAFLRGTGSTANTVTWFGTDLSSHNIVTDGNYYGSFFQFTGAAYFDANESVRHDDGI